MERLFYLTAGLLKDRATWVASITTGLSSWWSNLSFALPTTAAEWAALVLSSVSTVYVLIKISRLWRGDKPE